VRRIGAPTGFLTGGLPLALSRLAAGTLFGVEPHDGVTMVATLAVLAAIATVSGYLPANRASRIDPIRALRHE
jgi:ABC-type antimicrobial peptide transport system permease subunit